MFGIRPKVLAALYAALAVATLNIGNAVIVEYHGAWIPVVSALIPVVVAYWKKEEADVISGVPHDVVDPSLDGDDRLVG